MSYRAADGTYIFAPRKKKKYPEIGGDRRKAGKIAKRQAEYKTVAMFAVTVACDTYADEDSRSPATKLQYDNSNLYCEALALFRTEMREDDDDDEEIARDDYCVEAFNEMYLGFFATESAFRESAGEDAIERMLGYWIDPASDGGIHVWQNM